MQNDGADGEPSPEDGADAFKAAEQQFAVLWHMDKDRLILTSGLALPFPIFITLPILTSMLTSFLMFHIG